MPIDSNEAQQTEALLARDRNYLLNPIIWTTWPAVPMVHLREKDPSSPLRKTGLILEENRSTHGWRVYDANLFSPESIVAGKYHAVYPTLDALLADWRVD